MTPVPGVCGGLTVAVVTGRAVSGELDALIAPTTVRYIILKRTRALYTVLLSGRGRGEHTSRVSPLFGGTRSKGLNGIWILPPRRRLRVNPGHPVGYLKTGTADDGERSTTGYGVLLSDGTVTAVIEVRNNGCLENDAANEKRPFWETRGNVHRNDGN